MQGEHNPQRSFHAGIYDLLIPSDHLLRKIADTVDFDFVAELVSDAYCRAGRPHNGRPSWDPVILFKVVFLQFLVDVVRRRHNSKGKATMICLIVRSKNRSICT